MKRKILKMKIGYAYIMGNKVDVFTDAWEKTSKDGKTNYFEISNPIFIKEIEVDSQEVSDEVPQEEEVSE